MRIKYNKIELGGLVLKPSNVYSVDLHGLFDFERTTDYAELTTDGQVAGFSKINKKTINLNVGIKARNDVMSLLKLNSVVSKPTVELKVDIQGIGIVKTDLILTSKATSNDLAQLMSMSFDMPNPYLNIDTQTFLLDTYIEQSAFKISIDVWLRDTPSWGAEKLYIIKANDYIEFLEMSGTTWAKISHNGNIGYVDKQYIVETIPPVGLRFATNLPFEFSNKPMNNVATVNNTGNCISYPVFTISDAYENLYIENITTKQSMWLSEKNEQGNTVIIDCRPSTRSIKSNNKSITSLKKGDWIHCVEGENIIAFKTNNLAENVVHLKVEITNRII